MLKISSECPVPATSSLQRSVNLVTHMHNGKTWVPRFLNLVHHPEDSRMKPPSRLQLTLLIYRVETVVLGQLKRFEERKERKRKENCGY